MVWRNKEEKAQAYGMCAALLSDISDDEVGCGRKVQDHGRGRRGWKSESAVFPAEEGAVLQGYREDG